MNYLMNQNSCPRLALPRRKRKGKLAFAEDRPVKYEANMNLFWIVWELMLSGLMISCIGVWFFYAIVLVEDSVFQTRYANCIV